METNLDVVVGVHLKYILFLNRVVMKAYRHQTLIHLSPRARRNVPIFMRQEQSQMKTMHALY